MSLVGKAAIKLPKGVEYQFNEKEKLVTIKGPKGELHQEIHPQFEITHEDDTIKVKRPDDLKRNRALHGLYRALLSNMVTGVSEGFEVTLELVGVGYRVDVKGQLLEFSLGFSHPVVFALPPDISAESSYKKGESPKLLLRGIDKQLLGQVVAKIRGIRPPEPYKGKGIRFKGEQVRRKVGKAAGK